MINLILYSIIVSGFVWSINASEPIIYIKTKLKLDENSMNGSWVDWLRKLLACNMCLTFWVAFFLTGNPILAGFSSFAAELITRLMNKI